MAKALLIEDERGTYTGHYHEHRGYYAGDFFGREDSRPIGIPPHTGPSRRALRPTGSSPHKRPFR